MTSHASQVVKVGDEVKARVVDIMVKQNKITLSLQSEDLAGRERESIQRFKGESDTQTPKEQASAAKKQKRTAEQQEVRSIRRTANGMLALQKKKGKQEGEKAQFTNAKNCNKLCDLKRDFGRLCCEKHATFRIPHFPSARESVHPVSFSDSR